ncbi:MAG: hypothetical protein EDQ89_04175 [Acidobacteria bacterium]|nr:MAG: hypothetical protein EDQ89_04175 [Acidobacteriota bacterium]
MSSGSEASREPSSDDASARRSAKRPGPRETRSRTLPIAPIANPSRSGSSQQNQRSSARREANAAAQGSTSPTGTVTLISLRRPPAAARSARSATASRRPSVSTAAVSSPDAPA